MLHTKILGYKPICKLLSCNISSIIFHSFNLSLSRRTKAKSQILAAMMAWGMHIGIYNQPPARFSAPTKSPVALQKNPSKVNNPEVFFFIRVG
jgi:hypothetical protein